MKTFHCAIIGCGRIGCGFDDFQYGKKPKTHAGSYFKHPKTSLVALCDIDELKLIKYGKKFRVKNLYSDTKDMYKTEQVDLVSICTHVDTHLELVTEAIHNRVKAIFLEKPISNNLKDAEKIIKICKDKNVILSVNHYRRFDPFYHNIKKIINQKKLGDIQFVHSFYGGGIANTGSHLFDLLRFLFGDVKTVNANYSSNISPNNLDPNLDCVLEFKNGISCTLNALNLTNFGILEMDILGSEGRLKIDILNQKLVYYKIQNSNFLVYKNLTPYKIQIQHSKFTPMYLGVDNLIDLIYKKNKPLSTGYDALKSLELIISSIKSATSRKKINLPLRSNYIINSK